MYGKIRFNPRSKRFQDNPYDIYRKLRLDDPVTKFAGNWLITKHQHVKNLLADKSVKSINLLDSYEKYICDGSVFLPEEVRLMLNNILLLQEGHSHRMHKKGLIPLVTGTFMKELEAIIEEEVMLILNNIYGRKKFEVMSVIATELWQRIFLRWLNISIEQLKILVEAQKIIRPLLESPGLLSMKDFNDGITSLRRASLICNEMVRESKQLRNSLFYRALLSGYEGDPGEVEKNLFADVINILVASSETNESLIGAFFLELANDRSSQERLRREPQKIKQAINEVMRLHSPVQLTRRVATHSFWLDDKEIAAGDILLLCLGSANRDEDVFLSADQFDIDRINVARHIGFSSGLHSCLGQQLAIRQTEILCNLFFDNFPIFTLNPPAAWHTDNMVLRNIKVLNVSFESYINNDG